MSIRASRILMISPAFKQPAESGNTAAAAGLVNGKTGGT
jgi:hypothetical protein